MLSLLATVGLCLAMTTGPAAHAQTTPSTPSTTPVTVSLPVVSPSPTANQVTPTPDIIPRPNVGQEPRDPGDRGGWWQESLFFLMCGAVLFIGTLVWRDSRRARRRQGRLGPVTAAVATPGAHSEQLAVEPALERIVEPTVERAAGT